MGSHVATTGTANPSTSVWSQADVLVRERFQEASDYADDAFSNATSFLAALRNLFVSADMPDTDISYDFVEDSIDYDLESNRPDPPTDEELTPNSVTPPSIEDFSVVEVQDFDLPVYELNAPDVSFLYNEDVYASDLAVIVKTSLLGWITNGGTGLDADVEDAIWNNARARNAAQNEKVYRETETFFSSRGFTLPPGAMAGRLQEALNEQNRNDTQLNNEISIAQAKLAQNNTQFAHNLSVQYEAALMKYHGEVAMRAFQKAKETVQTVINLFNVKVQDYMARVEAVKARALIQDTNVKAKIAANKNVIDKYLADGEVFKNRLLYELGLVELASKVYVAKVRGYEADAKVGLGIIQAKIEEYRAKIQQANNQTILQVEEAKMILNSYLGGLGISVETTKAGANISAQLAASALSMVNASATLSGSASENVSHSTNKSSSLSNTLSEIHSYDETSV